jgi:predicted aspartyl protease
MTPLNQAGFSFALMLWACAPSGFGQNASTIPALPVVHSAPIELIHDKPYVEVLVNGRGPYRFLIDTGTGAQALVSPQLAAELALPTVGHTRLTDPTGEGDQKSAIVWIESLNVAGLEFQEVEAVQHRLFGEEQHCLGVLGFTLFEDYLMTLDYPKRRLVLSSGLLETGGTLLPFHLEDGVPIVTLQIDKLSVEAQVDTGGTGLSLPDAIAEQLGFESPPRDFAVAESLSTRFHVRAARLKPDVRFGPYVFRDAFVEVNSAFPIVNIGSTPLSNFSITFDQQEGMMRLYGKERVLHLNAAPVPLRMGNEPRDRASDPKLVPVG